LYGKPEDIIQGRWKRFTLKPSGLGVAGGRLDYVDMAVGANMLYWSCNVFGVSGVRAVAVRVPLESLHAGAPAPRAWKSNHFSLKLAQGCEDVGYFAAHNSTSSLRVYTWAENADRPTTHDVDVPTWRYGSSGAPWLNFDDSRIKGGAKIGGEVWFAWSVNTRSGRPFPFAQIVRVSTQNFTVTGSADVWQQNAAVGYPALAPNKITGEVGISYAFGTNAPSHAVGLLTGTPVHQTTVQGSPTSVTRWGDYLTIRQDYDDAGAPLASLAATGYARNSSGVTMPHFIEFERSASELLSKGSQPGDAAPNVDAFTAAAERLLGGVLERLRGGSSAEGGGLFPDVGLIEFELTVAGVTVRLKIASKDCCKGS
jgi:hypothetical protein